jgi:lipopolysaccharide heptosyltransferase III
MIHPPPKTILIVSIRLIGDVILTTPLIGLLKKAYPDADIDMLVARGTGEFLEKDPRVRTVIYSDKGVGGKTRRWSGYQSKIFRGYDLAINMNSSDRGNFAVLLAGKRYRVGFYQGTHFFKNIWKKLFFSHLLYFPPVIHVARNSQLVAEALGMSADQLKAEVFWSAGDKEVVDALLQRTSTRGPYFVLHPFARWRYKYWRVENFAAVSDAIVESYGWQPVWTSSPAEEEKSLLAEAVTHCRHRPVVIAGALNLNQMSYLITGARLYLGLDTAVSHLAAAAGTPMVAIYGPTIAERWSPWNNAGPVVQQCPLPRGRQQAGIMIMLQKDWACVPCGRAGCDDKGGESPCMAEVTVEDVLDAVSSVLSTFAENQGESCGS